MIEIRQSTFETNSSSVHVLVIPKDTPINIPKKVFLEGGEYGWQFECETNTINYLYQACVDAGKEELDKFFDYLKSKGVEEIYSPELKWIKADWQWNGNDYYYAENNPGYVDHGGEIPLDDLFANEDLLDRFLFGNSFVQTGNDNSEGCPDAEDYDPNIYDTIEKGN